MTTDTKLSPNESIKLQSRGLRGTLATGLQDQVTGALHHDDQVVIKHHGIYQQDDRDRRDARDAKKLERAYSYMARLRLPGGDIAAQQWRGIARIVAASGNGVVKITTRQTVQIHGVIKSKLKPTIQWFYDLGIDTIAACGDVNRNVASNSNPGNAFHAEAHAFAQAISAHLLPKTRAWYEIWLDEEKLTAEEPEEDPLYGKQYLPRKFKIGIAVPPSNDTDVLTNDIALIAIEENGALAGFNVAVGGGMGTTHGNAATYPRLATVIGYAPKEQALDVCWQIAATQRDFGNRSDRALSRLKYTVDRMGVEGFTKELNVRLQTPLQPARPYTFTERADRYAWQQDADGLWFKTLFVENGRVVDQAGYAILSAVNAIAETGTCAFRFTSNQNLMLTNIAARDKAKLDAILVEHGIDAGKFTPIRTEALACVALSTCPLALAEGQRYLPTLITHIEKLLEKHGLLKAPISIRMTGCPNGCARPHTAEIGLIGKSLGRYNLHLGGDALGLRMNMLTHEDLDEAQILTTLEPLFAAYAKERKTDERFGDYLYRSRKHTS